MLRSNRSWLLVATGIAAACQASPEPRTVGDASQPATTSEAAGIDTVEEVVAPTQVAQADSIWDYLRDKYDSNADGIITADEYDRAGRSLAGLDRDGDSQLSEADFMNASGPGGQASGMRAYRLIASHFQDDDDELTLSMNEVGAAFGAYDSDGDGALAREEFQALASERKRALADDGGVFSSMVGKGDNAFDSLTAVIDEDADDLISDSELIAFFEAHDDDADGSWTLPVADNAPAGEREEPATGAKVGMLAPDFTLEAPDGDATATLSKFRGDKPVALIFGSYT